MDNNKPNVIQQWAKNESVLKPKANTDTPGYVHPETARNLSGIPKPKASKKSIAALIASLMLAGGTAYWAKTGEPPLQDEITRVIEVTGIDQRSQPVVRPIPKPRPPAEPDWKKQQDLALAKNQAAIDAFERIAKKALDDFYQAMKHGLPHPGLCITTGSKTACHTKGQVIPLKKY